MKSLYQKVKHSSIPLLVSEVIILFVFVTSPLTYFGFPGPTHKFLAPLFLVLVMLLVWQHNLWKYKLAWVYFAFFLWMSLTSFFSSWDILGSFGGPIPRVWFICTLFFIVGLVTDTEKRRRWLTWIFSLSALTYSITYIVCLKYATMALLNPDFESSMNLGIFRNGRLHAFGNANTLGVITVVSVLEGCWLIVRLYKAKRGWIYCIPVGFYILLSYLMLGLSRSRGSILAVAGGIAAFTFITIFQKGPKRSIKQFFLAFALTLTTIAVSLLLSFVPKTLYDAAALNLASRSQLVSANDARELLTPVAIDDSIDNLSDRTLIWAAVIRMMNEKPVRWLTGITNANVHPNQIYDVYEGRPELTAYYAHSGYVESLLVYGLPGVFLLFVLIAEMIFAGVKSAFLSFPTKITSRLPISFAVAALINGVVEDLPIPYTSFRSLTAFFFLAAGCCFDLRHKNVPDTKTTKNVRKCLYGAVGIACALLCISKIHGKLSVNVTADEYIEYFNHENRKMIHVDNRDIDFEEISDIFNGEVLNSLITETAFTPDADSKYYVNGKLADDAYWEALEASLNLEELPRAVSSRFAISVTRTNIRRYPSDDSIYLAESDGSADDEMLQSDIAPLMPVIVLYDSADAEWYYLITYGYGGWVRKEAVAFCVSKEDWLNRMQPQDFLIVTDYEAIIGVNNTELSLPMGTVLPLCDPTISDTVIIPTRGADGYIKDVSVKISPEEQFNVGYLPYTEEILRLLALRHEGHRYGWAGSDNNYDCSSMTRSIYSCFGINLPRSAAAQATVSAAQTYNVKNDLGLGFILNVGHNSEQYKLKILENAPVGTLLYFPGHVMFYLGMEDGNPICISAVGSYSTKDLPVGEIVNINQTVVTDLTYVTRANGKSWLESLEKIIILQP